MDHRKGLDGRIVDGDRHEKKGGKNRKKGKMQRRLKGTYESGVKRQRDSKDGGRVGG